MEQITVKDRVGRIGSSSASQIYNIGIRGFINETDNELLALISGAKENREFSTIYTQRGNEIEDIIFQCLQGKYPNAVSNPYYFSEKLSNRFGFQVSNHIDYEIIDEDKGVYLWIEQKSLQNKSGAKEVDEEYKRQLAWHYMLMEDKFGKNKAKLKLSYYDATDYSENGFDGSKLALINADTRVFNDVIRVFKKGMQIISDALVDFVYVPKDELCITSHSLPIELQDHFYKIKQMEELLGNYKDEVKVFKERMSDLMQAKNIKKIELEDLGFSITSVPESTTTRFDSKRYEKEHPRLYQKYLKTSERKGYVKIKFKDKYLE